MHRPILNNHTTLVWFYFIITLMIRSSLFRVSILLFLLANTAVRSQDSISQTYRGNFEYGNFSTDLIFQISNLQENPEVFFSSPEQNAYGIPAREVQIADDSIKFVLQSDFHRYQFHGKFFQDDLKLLLTVDNKSFPFALTRSDSDKGTQLKSRDVRFRSDRLLLYGTLYMPEKPNGRAIYLVTSSGDQDRSATRSEAMFFAKQGYVTLHTDKRGTGMSDGNWQTSSIPELCQDDIRAITYLAETSNLRYADIGIKGSSQGASKVPYILSEIPEIGFGIIVSCPASSLLESDLNYWRNRNEGQLGSSDLLQATALQRSVFQFIAGYISRDELESQLSTKQNESWISGVWVPELESVQTDPKLGYTPLPYFNDLKQPILVIQGGEDQIIPSNSLEKIEELTVNQNPRNRYLLLDHADHSMMFKGSSDFPYWNSLHPGYRPALIEWMDHMNLKRKGK